MAVQVIEKLTLANSQQEISLSPPWEFLQAVPDDAKVYAVMIGGSIEAFLSSLAQTQAQSANTTAKARTAAKFDANQLQAIDARAAALGVRMAALKAVQAK